MKYLILLACVGIAVAKVDYTGHQVYRVYPDDVEYKIIKHLGDTESLDFWSDYRHPGDFVDFRVSPAQKSKIDVILAKSGISHEVFIADLEDAINMQIQPKLPVLNQGFDFSVYHQLSEIQNWIDDFSASNSALVTAIDIGKSSEGRRMDALKISTGSGRPAFVIDCGLHAREWVSPASCMWVANELVTSYNSDPDITNVMNSVDIYIIPIANPDGYLYTWGGDRMWRKTRSEPRTNGCNRCYGVDPNRNWDNHWDNPSGGASANCCSDAFRGASPFSEIEIVNQRDFVKSISNVKAYIDVHAYSQYWMYPYGWTSTNTPDEAALLKIGRDSVAAIKNVHGKTYLTGSIADVIYVATGSTADYFYDQGIKCSFAAELRDQGQYGFLLPENQIIPSAQEAFAGLMVIAGNVATGNC